MAKQNALHQINKLLAAPVKEPQQAKGKNWQEPEKVAKPFSLVHLLIIAVLFLLLGSYLSRQPAPIMKPVVIDTPDVITV